MTSTLNSLKPNTGSRQKKLRKGRGIGFDDRGKVKLSMKRVNQETGESLQ